MDLDTDDCTLDLFEVGLRCDDVHIVVSPFSGLRFCRTMGLGVFADLLASGRARRARTRQSLLVACRVSHPQSHLDQRDYFPR